MNKESLDEAEIELLSFVENHQVEREFFLWSITEIKTLARSRSVIISTPRSAIFNAYFPVRATFSGGKFDVQLVEDHLRNNNLISVNGIFKC